MRRDRFRRRATAALIAVGRVLVAASLGAPLALFALGLLPLGQSVQESIAYVALYTIAGLFLLRQVIDALWRSGVGARRVLIVGTGEDALAVERQLREMPYQKIHVVGFFNTDMAQAVTESNARVFSADRGIRALVEEYKVDEIIVAVREQRGGILPLRDLLECRVSGIRISDLPGFYERVRGEVWIESLKASWLIYGQGFDQDWLRTAVKRLFDLITSTALLLLALPVMLVTAILIKLESTGPVFYRQERVGRGGRPFALIKFRSMRADAEKDGVARWAQASDPRVTRVGALMRRMRIDELPQLINVLLGEMSLVGPRPERAVFVEQLRHHIRFYDLRHSVKPGMTGWAQVRYSYGASIDDAVRKLQFDLYYVKNHSLFLDLLVLIETMRAVIMNER